MKKCSSTFGDYLSFNNQGTWRKTEHDFDFVIVYPIDSLCREKDIKPIQNLFEHKHVKKIILCSWTDKADYDYSLFSEYYTNHIIYDALEEDSEYHKRVLECF